MASHPASKMGRTVGLESKKKKNTISFWLILIFIIAPAVFLTIMIIREQGQKSTKVSVEQQIRRPAPPFEQIRKKVGSKMMTDAQVERYCWQLRGTLLEWEGWVDDIYRSKNKYEAHVDMDNPNEYWSSWDVCFNIPAQMVVKLEKDQYIRFSGQVESIEEKILGGIRIKIKNVAILSE